MSSLNIKLSPPVDPSGRDPHPAYRLRDHSTARVHGSTQNTHEKARNCMDAFRKKFARGTFFRLKYFQRQVEWNTINPGHPRSKLARGDRRRPPRIGPEPDSAPIEAEPCTRRKDRRNRPAGFASCRARRVPVPAPHRGKAPPLPTSASAPTPPRFDGFTLLGVYSGISRPASSQSAARGPLLRRPLGPEERGPANSRATRRPKPRGLEGVAAGDFYARNRATDRRRPPL